MKKKFFFVICLSLGIANFLFGQTVITMQKKGGVYLIPCTVNGLKLKFIFDTGASNVSISLTEALFMLKNDYLKSEDIYGKEYYSIANGNIAVGTKIILREIEIYGLKLKNVEASVVNEIKAPLLLGQSAIAKLGKIQLDPTNNTLTILNKSQAINNYASKEDIKFIPVIIPNKPEKYLYEATTDYCMLKIWEEPNRNSKNVYPEITPLGEKFYIIKRRINIDGCACWDFVYCNGHYGYTLSPWLNIIQ